MTEKNMENSEKWRKRRGKIYTILLVLILIAGVVTLAYPTVSDWFNSRRQAKAIASYNTAVDNATMGEMEAMLAQARAYNRELLEKNNRFTPDDQELELYQSLLDPSGNGVMGYVQIDAIGVNLPVGHGTDEEVLQAAVGHLVGSSLPVGGESTHAVLSAHRGLPSAKLFSNLDRVAAGDRFTVTVLNQTLTYEVDQISVVLPTEMDALKIEEGKDYCTLVTCTPYGVNTHRLLVRGHRIEVAEEEPPFEIKDELYMIPGYLLFPALAIPLMFLVLLVMLLFYRRKRPELTREELSKLLAQHRETSDKKKED